MHSRTDPARLLLALLALNANQVAAQTACDDVWFTRNLLFDRAGYCFNSALGQALFDNSDCVGSDITLEPEIKRKIEEIEQLETRYDYRIDTSRTAPEIEDINIRRQLLDLPIRDEFESGCLGWLGEGVPLRADQDENSDIIGQVDMGNFVLFSFQSKDGWSYATTYTHDFSDLKAGGWTPDTIFPQEACADWAG